MNVNHLHTHTNRSDAQRLGDDITELAAHINAATFRFLELIREFDTREAWAETGAKSCAHWMNWRCGISVHTAREKLRVAHALGELPELSAAFARGELSFSKVRAATRVATAENESFLLDLALSGTASQLERIVGGTLRVQCNDAIARQTEQAFSDRHFGWNTLEDGSVEFFGRLPAELAEHVVGALHTVSQTLTKNVPAETPPRSAAEQRADALVALCQQNCDGYEVTVHVPVDAPATLQHGGAIPIDAARRLCCDAAVVPVSHDASGHVLDIGRRTRMIPPAIRRALSIRDKERCRFPGCTHTHFLHAHHIEHWAHGGKTCIDNLVLMCSHHHRLVHEGGFGCRAVKRRSGRGVRVLFSTPEGAIIPSACALMAAQGRLEDYRSQSQLEVNPFTCTATDAGSRLDVSMAVDGLNSARKHPKLTGE